MKFIKDTEKINFIKEKALSGDEEAQKFILNFMTMNDDEVNKYLADIAIDDNSNFAKVVKDLVADENEAIDGYDKAIKYLINSNEERKEFVKNELFEMSRKISPLIAKKYIYNKDNDK